MSYIYKSIEELLGLAQEHNISIGEVVLRSEMESSEMPREAIIAEIERRIGVFKESVKAGLEDTKHTPSGMSGGQAARMTEHEPIFIGSVAYKAMTYAIAVNEANAKMFRIVACPTAGSCGILPGVVLAYGEEHALPMERYVEAFLVAAGLGNVVTNRATVAGAVGGCQAEVGTAAAMAAGAMVAMAGGTPFRVVQAFTLCMKNVLGLVCDPVAGLVEVPCVKRNGMFAVHALSAAEMAMAGLISAIPADQVIEAMFAIGKALPAALRETSEGGLAMTQAGQEIAEKVRSL